MQTRLFNSMVGMPCKNIKKTCAYGIKRKLKMLNGNVIEDVHNGEDYIGDRSLMSIEKGKVLYVTNDDGTGSKTIVMAHGGVLPNKYVLLILYAHCDSFVGSPKINDPLLKGQIVANMGKTGNATGVHLHCSMYAIPPEVWNNNGKYYQWSYADREKYQINPSWVLGL